MNADPRLLKASREAFAFRDTALPSGVLSVTCSLRSSSRRDGELWPRNELHSRPRQHRSVIPSRGGTLIWQKIRAQRPAPDGTSLVCHKFVLIGGRPLPERPLWLRLLIVAVVLVGVAPLIKGAYAALPAFGINRPAKMTAEQTARALAARMPGIPANDPHRQVRCEEHARTTDWTPARNGAWDYICTVYPQAKSEQNGMRFGVRVGHDTITDRSSPHALADGYIRF